MQNVKTITLQQNEYGDWKWGIPSALRKGEISYTLRSFKTVTEAKRSARRNFGKTKLKFVNA